MIVNGKSLLLAAPIKGMLGHKTKEHGVSHGLTEAGYDIRIAEEIIFLPGRDKDWVVVNGEMREGRFTLASSVEEFQLPSNLVGVVHDKSTHARRGLSVFNTVMEPGWKGTLTIELVYHGRDELILHAGSGIAQVLFSKIAHTATYEGKYQNQEAGAQEARYQ